MFERLLDPDDAPDETAIACHLGPDGFARLLALEGRLAAAYALTRQLRFPYGRRYGWAYKYSHRSAHLCDVFFERGAFTVTLQFGDKLAGGVTEALPSLTDRTRELWANRYPCGDRGGWIHDRITADEDLDDVMKLLAIRKKPVAGPRAA